MHPSPTRPFTSPPLALDREDWVTINDVGGTYKGEIYLEMTFFASEPPQLARRPSKLPPQERLQHLKKPSGAAISGATLTVAGAHYNPVYHNSAHSPPKQDKPLPPIQESHGPAPLPSILRPGPGPGKVNGPGSRSDTLTSPVNSRPPPSSLHAGRHPTSPIQQPNNTNPFRVPGKHSPTSSGTGYDSSYFPPTGHSPPRVGHSPPHIGHSPPHVGHSPSHSGHSPPRVSHSPPRMSYSPPRRQSHIEQNPYISDSVPPSNPGSGFFPSPHIMINSSPPEPAPSSYHQYPSPTGYSPPHPPARGSPPISTYPGAPGFPSISPHPPTFSPPPSTSQVYSPPQPAYPPHQPGYPQPQSTYPPPQPGYPGQTTPPFPQHQSTYPQHQGTHPMYVNSTPVPGPEQRFFRREGSIGELQDPSLMHRYSSPLPLPPGGISHRTSSPFPVPSVPHPHPGPNTYSPSAEYERELQRRREQEERDAEIARQLDYELNLRG